MAKNSANDVTDWLYSFGSHFGYHRCLDVERSRSGTAVGDGIFSTVH